MTRLPLMAALLLCAASPAVAQPHQHGQSRYAGFEGRQIKGLSEEQIQELTNGDGMSLALPAELNHYPGPRHVLDLAQELGLSERQQGQVRAIEQKIRASARALGAAIIEKERELDQGFARRTMNEAVLRGLTGEIAQLQGDLRYAHLVAHLELREVLTEEQVMKYDELRGYRASSPR